MNLEIGTAFGTKHDGPDWVLLDNGSDLNGIYGDTDEELSHDDAVRALGGRVTCWGDAHALPFPDHTFDRVDSVGVLVTYTEDSALDEALRVLKVDGVLTLAMCREDVLALCYWITSRAVAHADLQMQNDWYTKDNFAYCTVRRIA